MGKIIKVTGAVQNFAQQLMQKGITPSSLVAVRNLLFGKTIKVVSVTNAHNYGPAGTRVKLDNAGLMVQNGYIQVPGYNAIYNHEFILDSPETKEELLKVREYIAKEIKELEDEDEATQAKINFMEETGVETFDEDQFKVYRTLKILKTTKSDLEKSKLIAELIKNS